MGSALYLRDPSQMDAQTLAVGTTGVPLRQGCSPALGAVLQACVPSGCRPQQTSFYVAKPRAAVHLVPLAYVLELHIILTGHPCAGRRRPLPLVHCSDPTTASAPSRVQS